MSQLLKRVVIKEELVKLTGDYKKAIILNQFIYWSQRVKDIDKFIDEEKERLKNNGVSIDDKDLQIDLQNGWIYKKAEELSEETMMGLSKSNMGTHIKFLVENGWLDQRTNPKYRWDKTLQYRVNILQIQQDLQSLGYALEGYALYASGLEVSKQNFEVLKQNFDEIDNVSRSSKTEPRDSETKLRNPKTESHSSETEQQYQRIQTKNTTESSSNNNNKGLAVADVSDDLQIETHVSTLMLVVGEQVSEASIRTWLKHGSVDRVMKCWFKAQEKSGVEDLGAYVTSLLKMNADQEMRVASNRPQTQQDEEPVIMQMWKARQEVAATSEFEPTDESNLISDVSLDANTDEAQKVWGNTLYVLEQNMSKPQFTTWFDKPEVRVLDFKNNTLIVEVPTDFHRDWLENQFSIQIKNAVCAITGRETAIKFVLPLSNEHKRA